jgi:hypothetical protein
MNIRAVPQIRKGLWMDICDYSRSFLMFTIDLKTRQPITLSNPSPTTLNNARIALECICEIFNRQTGEKSMYVLGASCKTELVGVPRDVWTQPNADFCLIASREEFMILKSWQRNNMGVKRYPESLGVQPERQVGAVSDAWTGFKIDIKEVPGEVLTSTEQIIEGVFANRALIARLEYEQEPWAVRIDCPVKTINVSERDKIYQTDTGPIILPDFSRYKTASRLVAVFDQAYMAFNTSNWAEFIISVPTPVAEGLSVNHYSKVRRIEKMRNKIIAIG